MVGHVEGSGGEAKSVAEAGDLVEGGADEVGPVVGDAVDERVSGGVGPWGGEGGSAGAAGRSGAGGRG